MNLADLQTVVLGGVMRGNEGSLSNYASIIKQKVSVLGTLYEFPLKSTEKFRFSDDFRGYRSYFA